MRGYLLLLSLVIALPCSSRAAEAEKFPCYNCRTPQCPQLDAPPCEEAPKVRRRSPPRPAEDLSPPPRHPQQRPTSDLNAVGKAAPILPPAVNVSATTSLPQSFWRRHRISFGLGGIGLALAMAGAGVAISTYRGYADLAWTCAGSQGGCPASDVASIEVQALATNILFGLAGGVALAAGGVFLIGERRPSATPTVVLGPGQTGAGLLVHY